MAVSLNRACVNRVVYGLAAVVLSACATMGSTPEGMVRARAAEHWKARTAGNLDITYAYAPPSYRAATPLDRYKKGFGDAAQVVMAEVTDVKCETEDKCVATAKLEVKPVLVRGAKPPPLIMYYDEVWVREGGQWWLFPTQ